MISTSEAARRLHISQRRVIELVNQGALQAEKSGGVWLVAEDSVAQRLQTNQKRGGRPPRGKGKHEQRFMLMNRTHEVAEVVYDTAKREFTLIGDIADISRAPIGLVQHGAIDRYCFNVWWRDRGIPQARDNLVQILQEARVQVPEELLYRNLGLSLSDQYWIRPCALQLQWEDINFFANSFKKVSEVLGSIQNSGTQMSVHPDNTSDGNLAKHWVERGKKRVLQKGARHYSQEPYNEVVATALHKRLLKKQDFVPYTTSQVGGAVVSECLNFLTNEEEYVPAYYVARMHNQPLAQSDYQHYVTCCEELKVQGIKQALAKMIVCDDILANHDRHWRNFGLIRNVETLECRPAPLFDSGSSLWCNIELSVLKSGEFSFACKPFEDSPARQMLLVEDFSWANEKRLDGFIDEAMEILAQDEWIAERLPCIRTALQRRVERMTNIIEWS